MANNEETTEEKAPEAAEEKAPESTGGNASEKPAPAEDSVTTASSSVDDVKAHALGLIDTITDKVKSLIADFTEKKPVAPAEAEVKNDEEIKSDDEAKSDDEKKSEGDAKPDA